MKNNKKITIAIVASFILVALIAGFLSLIYTERYQNAVDWAEEGVFSKATCYVDEFPFIINLFDPGFVSYVYAGEALEYGNYDEALELLKPLADKNYRDSVQLLEDCMEQLNKLPD